MPLISYLCSCGELTRKYLKDARYAAPESDCKCGLKGKKVFGSTSSSHKIVIDNGLMAKRLEIDPEIMEINDERSSRDYSEED